MTEIKREPIIGDDGDSVTFDANHTHSDILRYVINDVGPEHANALMRTLAPEDPIAVYVPLICSDDLLPPTPPKAILVNQGAAFLGMSSDAEIREKP